MKKTCVTASLLVLSFLSLAQSNDSLQGPRVWLRADRSTLINNNWTDVSHFRHDASAASAREVPSLTATINFNKAIQFDGIDDYFKIPYSLEGATDITILSVFQSADTTERGVWGSELGTTRNLLLTTRKAIGPDTIADRYGKSERVTVLNSVLQNWDNVASAVPSNSFLALGSAGKTKGYKAFKGAFAELIVFNRAISFLERIQFETYLAIKYGTGLRVGNFVSSGAKMLWHQEENKAYGNNIAGIGRDDFFKLYQKQSGSMYDSSLLVMSAGILAKSNDENLTTITDQDFVLWGDNGLPLSAKQGVGADSLLSVVQRKWLVTATGPKAKQIPLEVHVDAAKFQVNPLGYWLVIDRSGNGNFSIDNLEYIAADRVSNGKIIYKNVMWDTDGAGKDNFGFAQAHELFAVVRTIGLPSCSNETAGQVNIEVIAGRTPFVYSLTNAEAKIQRDGKQSAKQIDQKDLVAGEYELIITDADGKQIERHFSLSVPDALDISLGPDQTLTGENNIALDVSNQIPASAAVSVRWESNFGFESFDKKIAVSESGIYRVFVTRPSDGCVFTDDIVISGAESQRVAVYPNLLQSNENYNVSISLEEPGSVTVKVYNARGIQVYGMQGSGQSEYQFISGLKDTGMYLVVIQTPNGIETRKIVVQ
jgi:hypothetical protein